jgi:salicylate hydroxylase
MSPKKFHVAVCGGGIGGLTAALALSKYPDIDVTIYESAAFFSEVGAGVGVWPRIWKTLAKLGLDQDLARVTHLVPRTDLVDTFQFRKSDQPNGKDYYKLQTQGSFLTYHRPDFQNVLVDHLPPSVNIHYKKRLSKYVQREGKVILTFEDGTTASTDLLLGADGIKSAVRRCFLYEQADLAMENGRPGEADILLNSIEPQWTGIVAYRNLIPVERLQKYAETNKSVRVPKSDSIPTMVSFSFTLLPLNKTLLIPASVHGSAYCTLLSLRLAPSCLANLSS